MIKINFLFISIEESFFIIFIAVLIFGPKNIPHIARGLGEGIRYIKEARNKIKNDIFDHTKNIIQEKNKKNKKNKQKIPFYSVKKNK